MNKQLSRGMRTLKTDTPLIFNVLPLFHMETTPVEKQLFLWKKRGLPLQGLSSLGPIALKNKLNNNKNNYHNNNNNKYMSTLKRK